MKKGDLSQEFYVVNFMFRIKELDKDFHALNEKITKIARASEGYVDSSHWVLQEDKTVHGYTYYWKDMESLRAFSQHPVHQEAKRRYAEWLDGYHVEISQLIHSYGDGGVPHLTPPDNRL